MNNINLKLSGAEIADEYSEKEFHAEFVSKGYVILEDDRLQDFITDVNKMITKGNASGLSTEQLDSIEKAKKDLTKLVRKIVVDKNGKKVTKWVKMEDAGHGSSEHHLNMAKHDKELKRLDDIYSNEGHPKAVRQEAHDKMVYHQEMRDMHEKMARKTNQSGSSTNTVNNKKDSAGNEFIDGKIYKNSLYPRVDYVYFEPKKQFHAYDSSKGHRKLREVIELSDVRNPENMVLRVGVVPMKPNNGSVHGEAWERHQHNMKVQRQGKEASLKHIESKYGADVAKHVREKHEAPVKQAETKSKEISRAELMKPVAGKTYQVSQRGKNNEFILESTDGMHAVDMMWDNPEEGEQFASKHGFKLKEMAKKDGVNSGGYRIKVTDVVGNDRIMSVDKEYAYTQKNAYGHGNKYKLDSLVPDKSSRYSDDSEPNYFQVMDVAKKEENTNDQIWDSQIISHATQDDYKKLSSAELMKPMEDNTENDGKISMSDLKKKLEPLLNLPSVHRSHINSLTFVGTKAETYKIAKEIKKLGLEKYFDEPLDDSDYSGRGTWVLDATGALDSGLITTIDKKPSTK